MQYFKKHSKNSNNIASSLKKEGGVINLNRTVQICVDRATILYSCKLQFDVPSVTLFSKIPAEDIIKQIFFVLEQYCASRQSLTIKLEQQANSQTAVISFVSDNTIINTIEIELYTGTPDVVVKESYDTDDVSEITDSVIECILKMRAAKN